MEAAIVLYPSPPIGHLVAMVELGQLILTRHPSLSIHILITTPPYRADDTAKYIASVSTTNPSLIFHHLSTVSLPPSLTSSSNHESLTFEILRLNNPNVRQALLSISTNFSVRAFVPDFFCALGLSVAADLNIPGYFFFTSGAACLASFLYFPTLHTTTDKSFKDLNALISIPGVPPVPSSDMAKPILDRNDMAYQCFLENSKKFPKSAGIIINTYESLEPRAIRAISDGLCLPENVPTPPIYCIGPLIIAHNKKGGGGDDVPECLTWLDSQPSGSVVFLCFGSLGLFSKKQLQEIAIGLERSGQRFLWVVRNPPAENNTGVAITEQPDPELESLLPDGFLGRTKSRGLVVKSWAPQVAVLNHESVGGFVSHCGWNSVLEAVCAGVPIVAWRNQRVRERREERGTMVKFLKPNKAIIILQGRYAGRKAVIVRAFDDGTRDRPYGHCLVAGIKKYPSKVIRKDSAKKTAKKSRVKPFVKLVNYQHLMPTRYTLDVDLKDVVNVEAFATKDKKVTALKETKKRFEERFKTGKNRWFFTKLRF